MNRVYLGSLYFLSQKKKKKVSYTFLSLQRYYILWINEWSVLRFLVFSSHFSLHFRDKKFCGLWKKQPPTPFFILSTFSPTKQEKLYFSPLASLWVVIMYFENILSLSLTHRSGLHAHPYVRGRKYTLELYNNFPFSPIFSVFPKIT